MVRKGNLAVFEGCSISETERDHAHQNWCACTWHQSILAWIFWADSDRLNFLMTMDYSPWSEREIWLFLRVANISETERDHTHQNWCACTWHQSLLAWIFWADSDRLNFLMTMDYSPWSEREIWPFLRLQYLRNRRDHAHQNWCTCMWHQHILAWIFWANSDRLNFLMTMDYSPWSEREIWPFLRVAVSPKPERPRPPKLVCMHLTSIPTCMNFLSQFRSIKFFDDHGL